MKKLLLLIYIYILFSLVSCTYVKTYIDVRNFEKQVINFPEVITSIEYGEIKDVHCSFTGPIFIVYFGPEDCLDCKLAHLSDYYPLFALSDEFAFNIMLLVSPSVDEHSRVMSIIKDGKYQFPVFIDSGNAFSLQNRNILNDSRFNHFLIDDNRHPVFVGNPLSNRRLYRQFIKQL